MSNQGRGGDLVEVFKDTQTLYNNDPRLQVSIQNSIDNTIYYGERDLPPLGAPRFTEPMVVSVSRHRTLEAAMWHLDLQPTAKVAVLNFASGTNPGGGVVKGSKAQEESICRCSTLYPVLMANSMLGKAFYGCHKALKDARYSDACIYTPGITVFKSDTDRPERLPHNKWRQVDVITCAAPNLKAAGKGVTDNELLELHRARGRKIMRVAAEQAVDVLILGAFGCGAFQNPPWMVAKAYRELLEEFDQNIPRVEFAIYCPPGDDRNYRAFAKVMR